MKPYHLHHLHQRKRVHHKLEPYPHPNPSIRFLDNLVLLVAVIGPVTNLPQIFKIFSEKNAAGISVFTWMLWIVMSIIWLIYGIVHKEKPIIISSTLWTIAEIVVIYATLLYS